MLEILDPDVAFSLTEFGTGGVHSISPCCLELTGQPQQSGGWGGGEGLERPRQTQETNGVIKEDCLGTKLQPAVCT